MKHSEGTFRGSGNQNIYLQKWSPDSEVHAKIVLVHGIGEHSGRYMNVVNYFVPLGFEIYAYDHRGHGKSDGKRGHVMAWSEFREDLHIYIKTIRTESSGKPIFLMGHSLGGLITLDYCLHYPESLRAVIVSSPALGKPGVPAFLLLLSKIMSRIWPGLTIETKLEIEAISRDPEVIRDYQDDPLVHSKATARLGTEFEDCRQKTLSKAKSFTLPLLIYHGKDDRIVSPNGSIEFYQAIPTDEKELHLLEGGYHEPHNDIEKEKVFSIINKWIALHL